MKAGFKRADIHLFKNTLGPDLAERYTTTDIICLPGFSIPDLIKIETGKFLISRSLPYWSRRIHSTDPLLTGILVLFPGHGHYTHWTTIPASRPDVQWYTGLSFLTNRF
jgi:hypothetical protein